MFREAMVEKPGGDGSNQYEVKQSGINDNVINSTSVQGNSKAYTVSRLKNNRPDLFEKVVSGELDAIMKAKRGQTVGEVLALKPNGTNQFTSTGFDKNKNVKPSDDGGNSATYRIAKLKRDAPEIAERRFNSALASPVDIRTL
jgi:hypothetical protein